METNADMLWRITVTVQGKNMAHRGPVEYAGRIVKVRNGISFLRLERPAVDPRGPGQRPEDPAIIRVMGRRPDGHPQARRRRGWPVAADAPGQVRARDQAAGRDRMVPLVPFPASSVTDRLYPVTETSLLDTPGADAAGKSNPLLDAVQALLREHAPDLLEANWTVEGTTSTEGKVSPKGKASTQGKARPEAGARAAGERAQLAVPGHDDRHGPQLGPGADRHPAIPRRQRAGADRRAGAPRSAQPGVPVPGVDHR